MECVKNVKDGHLHGFDRGKRPRHKSSARGVYRSLHCFPRECRPGKRRKLGGVEPTAGSFWRQITKTRDADNKTFRPLDAAPDHHWHTWLRITTAPCYTAIPVSH